MAENPRDAVAIGEAQAQAIYEAVEPGGRPWTHLAPDKVERYRRAASAVGALERQAVPMCVECSDQITAHDPGLCGICYSTNYEASEPAQAEAPSEDGRFLLLPQRPKPEWPASNGFPHDRYSGVQMLTFGRECSDAALATHTEQPLTAALAEAKAVVPVASPPGDGGDGEYALTFYFWTWDALTNANVAWMRRGANQPAAQGDLYWRLHTLSKLLEGSGRIDEMEHRDAYPTILDAMALARSAEATEQAAQAARAADPDAPERWCWYHEGDERVPVLDSEEEAHSEAQQWIDDNCEPGEEHEYLVAPMKSGRDLLPSPEHVGNSIFEHISECLSDEMGAEEDPLDLTKEDISKLGEMVRQFFRREGTVQWWTVDSKRETKHTGRAAISSEGGAPC